MLTLSESEQKAILADLSGIECLINYHDCKDAENSAYFDLDCDAETFHAKRVKELLILGRTIIAEDPDIWFPEQIEVFKLRHYENHTRSNKD